MRNANGFGVYCIILFGMGKISNVQMSFEEMFNEKSKTALTSSRKYVLPGLIERIAIIQHETL